MDYIDIVVRNSLKGHEIYLVTMDNRLRRVGIHYPWFTVYSPVRPKENIKKVVSVSKIDGVPLIYEESSFMYLPKRMYKIYKVEGFNRADIPSLAQELMKDGIARSGLYNIRYEARVALDLSREHRLLGFRAPLVFLPNDEMVSEMERAIDSFKNLKVMALDIEVYSTTGGFPKIGDPILTISYSVFRVGDDIFSREWPEKNVKVLSIPRSPGMPLSEMTRHSKEIVNMLFEDVILKEKPNLIVTYNGSNFDFPYIRPFASRSIEISKNFVIMGEYAFPHIDLMTVRDSLGSSMGIRSHAAYALDDVALEIADSIKKMHNIEWLFTSEYIEAERVLNHAKLKEFWERGDPVFHNYIVADVYLTSLIARVWLYSLLLLSVMTCMPPTLIQSMNTGQIAEYIMTELLTRLGFYPELRQRSYEFSRTDDKVDIQDSWVFNKGKVYVDSYGLFGGDGKKVIELDFAQLYPTDMVVNTSDPTMIFIVEGRKNGKPFDTTLRINTPSRLERERTASVILGVREKKSSTTIRSVYAFRVMPGYGPISWLIYKLYTARRLTKALKNRAKEEKRVELLAPDQSIKILNNSFYGSFSKQRGNLVSELVSASVFWRTQKMLYEVVGFINTEMPKILGADVKVLYGDTDSAYILVPDWLDPEMVAEKVNEFVKTRFGELYEMELEDVYDAMVIPKLKEGFEASAKSYITIKNGKAVKVKGEFFKINAPSALKDRLIDFYIEIINRKPKSESEVREILREMLEKEPIYKLFIKKSISSFVNEDDPRRLKSLNKDFHYASLYTLYLYNSPGVKVLGSKKTLSQRYMQVRLSIDPRVVERAQGVVLTNYLSDPSGNPKSFLVYIEDDGEKAVIDHVTVTKFFIDRTGDGDERVDKTYEIELMVSRMEMPRSLLLDRVINSIDKYVTRQIYRKLVLAMLHKKGIQGEPTSRSHSSSGRGTSDHSGVQGSTRS